MLDIGNFTKLIVCNSGQKEKQVQLKIDESVLDQCLCEELGNDFKMQAIKDMQKLVLRQICRPAQSSNKVGLPVKTIV